MGPTCAGKTRLAMELFNKFPIQIISVDSVQIYKHLDVGSSKPSQEILNEYPHSLINILEPNQSYSTAKFQVDCIEAIKSSLEGEKIPILVGGTMMYFHHLINGISDLPEVKKITRKEIEEEFYANGIKKMYSYLKEIDLESANRIHPNDTQRIKRAIEIYRETGKQMSILQKENISKKHPLIEKSSILQLSIIPKDLDAHRNLIAQRFQRMIKDGLVEEVENILKITEVDHDSQSMKSVGYRQVCEFLRGEIDHDVMMEKAINSTRQLSKRQITWLKGWKNLISMDNDASLLLKVEDLIKRYK